MTIARDIRTGAVVGQVLPMWSAPLNQWPRPNHLRLLTAKGTTDVDASTVRLEKVS